MSERRTRTILLPTDVLLIIFENLPSPLTYPTWRRDLFNCALVCREWTCALHLLLLDFRSVYLQRPGNLTHPPEIVRFANALLARPTLALQIKHLSVYYFESHRSWRLLSRAPLFMLPSRQSARCSQFSEAFLSIVRLAKNVQTLFILPRDLNFVASQSGLTNALSGCNTLHKLMIRHGIRMAQLLSCIATCSSLKYLTAIYLLPPDTPGVPLPLLSCHLTALVLLHVAVMDDELTCLMKASSATLQRLSLNHISHLTNAGLGAALTAVCESLEYLDIIMHSGFARAQEEEHALDATIARMERLTELNIVPGLASAQMLERRAEAFVQQRTSTAAVLSEVHLDLVIILVTEGDSLVCAVERDWPGWKIDQSIIERRRRNARLQ